MLKSLTNWGLLLDIVGVVATRPHRLIYSQVGFTVGSSALGGLLLVGVSWRLLFHITTIFAFIMAALLAVGMPDEFPYDLGGGGSDDYNLGTRPTQVSLDPGAGKVSPILQGCTWF